jgi:hypothetical protein
MPMETFMIALPPGAVAQSVNVVRSGERVRDGVYRVKPASGIVIASADERQNARLQEKWRSNYDATYGSDAPYPAFEGKLACAGTLRKYSYVAVAVSPFTYRPLSGRLLSYNSARITVEYLLPAAESAEARMTEEAKSDRAGDSRAARLFVNYAQMKDMYEAAHPAALPRSQTFDYVILTDEALADLVTASDFCRWKKDTGNNVLVLTTSHPAIAAQPGRDLAERIRNFLRSWYLSRGVEHLLIVGDYATVPMRYCSPDTSDDVIGDVPTDYYYADLSLPDDASWNSDGDGLYGEYGDDSPDLLADIYVGRIPTSIPYRVEYTLGKLAAFEQDTGEWKNRALHPGAILFFENIDYSGYPFMDGARLQDRIETDLMGGWEVTHYSEKEGLRTSDFDWPAISEESVTTEWGMGRYGVVNWSAHGAPYAVGRSIWEWDDGDGVPESFELTYPWLVSVDSNLDDDSPSIVFAVSCLVGYPEPDGGGRLGVDLLTKRYWGAASAVISATRSAAITALWPEEGGGSEGICYEFNRYMICGPDGSEMVGNALYDGKFYNTLHYGWDLPYEYLNMFDFNLYGDPAMLREGVSTPVCDNEDPGFVELAGSWESMSYAGAHGGTFRYNPAGTGENRAAWRVDHIVAPGKYDVYVWKFDHPFPDLMATDARFAVRDRDSLSGWIRVDQSAPGDEWVYLGSFEFDTSRLQGVVVTDQANGYVIADAVKLVYTGSLPQ